MKIRHFISVCTLLGLCFTSCDESLPLKDKGPLAPVSFEKVTLQDSFWLPRLKNAERNVGSFFFG